MKTERGNRLSFEGAVVGMSLFLAAVMLTSLLVPTHLALKRLQRKTEDRAVFTLIDDDKSSVYDLERDGEVLRLHVIANSDDGEDQRVKLEVRDAILALEREKGAFTGAQGAEDAEKRLLENGELLLETVRGVLKREGASYDAQLLIGDFDFPDREYDGKLYPAGSYRALRVMLGNAQGRNWWCILFPPLCIINTSGETGMGNEPENTEAENEESIHFESFFLNLFKKLMGENRYE